jgi:hypothetical protein
VELLEDIGAEGIGDDDGPDSVIGTLLVGDEGLDGRGFETGDSALLPVAADEGVYQFGFDYTFGAEFFVVFAGDVEQVSFVFAGDDQGSGIGAVFQGVEAG